MSEAVIRKCAPGDEDDLSLVGQAAFLEAFAGVVSGRDILAHCRRQHATEKYAAWLRDANSAVWMVEVNPGRAPVGYLVLTAPDLPLADIGPGDLEIKRVYLLHRFQGGGIGARLMNAARDHAIARGSRRLLLGVYSGNIAAIGFYERLGYKRVGTRPFKVGENTYNDLIFSLGLGR
ncbi:MAG: GNAT family N-acetyltransferase [Opitutaceae bacterium]|nr:GNAT family N-acetyltransferase [Opitutaceae bacterium]